MEERGGRKEQRIIVRRLISTSAQSDVLRGKVMSDGGEGDKGRTQVQGRGE